MLPFIASTYGTIHLGATRGLLHPDDHPLSRGTRLWPHPPRRLPSSCGTSRASSIPGPPFFAATVGVAAISKMELLRSICLLISRGALISMLVILVMLPAALMLCDWLIRHTTLKWIIPNLPAPHWRNEAIFS